METQKRQNRRLISDYLRITLLKNIILKKYKEATEVLALTAATAYKNRFMVPSTIEEFEKKNCEDKHEDSKVPKPPRGQKRKLETIASPTAKKCRRSLSFE